jgi:hypothetical protein
MAITIGLDFGTHQTKICIENSDDPQNKTYEFYDWGNDVYALPSVIQINKDHTISYGHINLDRALIDFKKKTCNSAGELVLPDEPVMPELKEVVEPTLPPMPIAEFVSENGTKFRIPYKNLYRIGLPMPKVKPNNKIEEWNKTCRKIKMNYERKLKHWKLIESKLGFPKPELPNMPPKPSAQKCSLDINPKMIATDKQIAEYKEWKLKCQLLLSERNKLHSENKSKMEMFKERHEQWINECNRLKQSHAIRSKLYLESIAKYPMVFRYFKQATFASYKWEYRIEASTLSILYLAYIIFRLEERFGNNFAIQMGIPASRNSFKRLKEYASGLLIQAIRLVEDVYKNDFDKFLRTPYEDLIALIPKFEYSQELKFQYGLLILPEAYAALRSATANGRISKGMSLMLDVGGGTTDLSFFIIKDNGEPQVYHFESISKGLNFFLEYGNRVSHDFSVKRELEDLSNSLFSKAYKEYKDQIDKIVNDLINFLHLDTISRNFGKRNFKDAIINRPVVYTGGGCYHKHMRNSVLDFTDVMHIDKKMLRIPNVVNEKRVTIPYSILATSFGLSLAIISDDVKVSSKEDLFAGFEERGTGDWDAHREHGMYED